MAEQKIAAMWKCPREDFDRLVAERGVTDSATGWSLVRDYGEYELRLKDLAMEAKVKGADAVYAITVPLDDWRMTLRDNGCPDTPEGWGQCAIRLLTPQLKLGLKIADPRHGKHALGWALVNAPDLSTDSRQVERLA